MFRIAAVVPTRGRPVQAREMYSSIIENSLGDIDVYLILDPEDRTVPQYRRTFRGTSAKMLVTPVGGFVAALNWGASQVVDNYDYIFNCGDDHRIRTDAWDYLFFKKLATRSAGIIYGDDLFQGEHLPTAVMISSNIVKALGYFGAPCFLHLFVDDVWKRWGEGADCLLYVPEVIIEHLHYTSDKSKVDETYLIGNNNDVRQRDADAYTNYMNSQYFEDIEKIKSLVHPGGDHSACSTEIS